ncbi:MAG: hypothetical protein AB7J32_00370 [Pseudonocardia sp.]
MTASTPTRRSPMMTVVAAVALAMVLFLVNRAGEPLAPVPPTAAVAAPAPVSYEGATEDGRVAVSVTVTGDRAEGRVAGRAGRSGAPLAAFLDGPAVDGRIALGADGVHVEATVDGDRLRGTVRTGDGRARPFTAVAEGGASR